MRYHQDIIDSKPIVRVGAFKMLEGDEAAEVEALTEELQKMLLEQTDIDSERLIEIQNRLQELTGK